MLFSNDFSRPQDNAYLRIVRRTYRLLHFERGYNFPLWIIFGGAMLGFGCARVMYLDIYGIFAPEKIINGDWEAYREGVAHVGIIMHLAGVIPICFLIAWQFLPLIRHKAMWFHRINGYVLILLLLVGNVGAFLITRRSMGGLLENQTIFGVMGIWTTFGLAMAYYNIKRLQIDQHRAWMLRTWFVAAVPVTMRIIQQPTWEILTNIGAYYHPMACHTITYITTELAGQDLALLYPACQKDPVKGWAAVNINFNGRPEEIGAALNGSFGPAMITAIVLHVVGIEIYLHLTKAEHARLKQVSYERQLARGIKRPDDAGVMLNIDPAVVEAGRKSSDGTLASGDQGMLEKKASPEEQV